MMEEKYIFFIKDNVYRIKIIKKNPRINYDRYFKCSFQEAIKIRNEILEKNNYSKTFKTLSEARKQRKIKMSEKMLINSREGRNQATINEFVNVWFSIYCIKELKTTTSYSMMNTLNKNVLAELGNDKISNNPIDKVKLEELKVKKLQFIPMKN